MSKNTIRDIKEHKPNDHLANERTYLAWVRTGVGIMAFGFVVVKFSLFLSPRLVLYWIDRSKFTRTAIPKSSELCWCY